MKNEPQKIFKRPLTNLLGTLSKMSYYNNDGDASVMDPES